MSQLSVFAHVTAVNAPLYRTVMTAFHRAREQFVLHLRPDDVLISLREAGFFQRPVQGDEDEPAPMDRDYVSELLKRLWDWGNLRAFQDTAEVATVDEFMRKRFLYQMTPEGEAAEAALAVFEEHLARPGELQTTALEDIQLNLAALEKLAADKEPDAARVASLLGELSRRFADLTGQAQRFMGGLQRHIDLYEVEIDVFMAYKEMLLDYLDRFIRELVVATSRITGLLLRLEDRHISRLLHLTAERELKDVLNPTDSEREQRQRNWESRWQGLRSWFIAATGQKSQAEVLRGRALQAIPDLISVVAAINERRTTRGDRLADLRVLARWFAECDSDADAHRLWRAAFGLHQARHLRINADTLAKWEEKQPHANTSWLQAPVLSIAPRLRQYGSTRRRGGKPTTIIDRSVQKRHLAMIAQEEARQLAIARRRLAMEEPMLLSDLHVLDPVEFNLFFDLLTRALAGKRKFNDTIETSSTDGTMEIKLEPVPDADWIEVQTTMGTLTARQHRIFVRDIFPVVTAEGAGVEEPA